MSARRQRLRRRLLASAVVVGLVAGLLAATSTWSAFSGATANPANSLAAGTVTLGDNDSGSAVFNLTGLKPGDTDTGCITVTSTATIASLVRLYGATGGTGLDAYLTLTITRGTSGGGSFDDCTGFTADTTNWVGAGNGVIYTGTLAAFGDDWAGGTVDAAPAVPEAWTPGESHAYKLALTLADTNSAQGTSMTQTFTWEARNTSSYSQVVLSDGPAAYWRLDEAAGTTAADAAGTNNGTYTNGPTLNQPTGVRDAGTAVNFDGSNDFFSAPDSPSLSPTTAVTVEAWIRPDQFGALRTIVQKTNSYWLRLESSGALTMYVYDGTSYEPHATGTTLVAGTLYHVVGTFDGANLRVYVDGTLRGTTARAVTIQDNGNQVNVGVGGSYFDGVMDEVAVYGKALSAQQISEHYLAGHG